MGKWDREGRLKRHIQNLWRHPKPERPKEGKKTGVSAGLVVTYVCLICFVAVGQPYYSVVMLSDIFVQSDENGLERPCRCVI